VGASFALGSLEHAMKKRSVMQGATTSFAAVSTWFIEIPSRAAVIVPDARAL
jgi:hypothetical protein